MRTFSNAPRFEARPDGTIYARAGVQTNCGGIAGILVRIQVNPAGSVVFTPSGDSPPVDEQYGSPVRGVNVPREYRNAVYRGAREALAYRGLTIGVTFELIEALVHEVDARESKFFMAGCTAMAGWLDLQFPSTDAT
jgi:hypothetical protein